ncbi:T9SS type A sorting domain-containing protein [Arcticibacterium luteifluviistationis]|nr:T9SS type A sorting domain-containing protein [Arcticibacterium luteifluviistationis]
MKQLLSLLLFLSFLSSPVFAQKFTDITPKTDLDRTNNIKTMEYADFDGDGDIDLAVSGSYSSSSNVSQNIIGIYKNDGQGNFSLNLEQDVIYTAAVNFKIKDLDFDGDEDIYFVELEDDSDTTQVFYYHTLVNDGQGNFIDKKYILDAPALGGYKIDIGDFDGDNDYDLILTGSTIELREYVVGSGFFSETRRGNTFIFENQNNSDYSLMENANIDGYFSANTVFADLDGDSDIDFIVSGTPYYSSYSDGIGTSIYLNNGNKTFSKKEGNDFSFTSIESMAGGTRQLALNDIDLDGDLDLVMSMVEVGFYYTKTKVFKNDGLGNFTIIGTSPFENYSANFEFLDFNEDGYDDIIMSGKQNLGFGNASFFVPRTELFLNSKGQGYVKDTLVTFEDLGGMIKCFDFDNDGYRDVLTYGRNHVISSNEDFLTFYLNKKNESFNTVSKSFFGDLTQIKSTPLDFNADNFPDILITGINKIGEPETKLYLNLDGTGSLGQETSHPFPSLDSTRILFEDFNNDGIEDVVFVGIDSLALGKFQLFLKSNEGTFTSKNKADFQAEKISQIEAVDINQDGWMDIGLTGIYNDSAFLYILFNNQDGSFGWQDQSEIFNGNLEGIQFGIIDGDAYPDILLTNGRCTIGKGYEQLIVTFSNPIGLGYSLQNTDTTKFNHELSALNKYYLIDTDKDGDDDIIAAISSPGGYSSNVSYYGFQNEGGIFNRKFDEKAYAGYSITAQTADFNNDETEDFFALSYVSLGTRFTRFDKYKYSMKMLLNIDNVLMKETICQEFKSYKEAEIKTTDFNADGNTDILITGIDLSGQPAITIYLNDGSQLPYAADKINACDSTTWLNGKTYTSNNFEDVYPPVHESYSTSPTLNCDPRAMLYLTMGKSDNWIDTVNATGEFTWIDGNTYYKSNNTATYTLTNQSGCDSTVSLNLTLIPLANEMASSVTLFPNPSGERLKLDLGHETPENIEYKIFNTAGLEIKTWESNLKEQLIDISRLPTGTYILKYQEGLKSESMKFVKR